MATAIGKLESQRGQQLCLMYNIGCKAIEG